MHCTGSSVTSMSLRRCSALLLPLLLAAAAAEESEEELNTEHYGRLHSRHPVRHCCMGEACSASQSRQAFVTSMRSADYLMGLRELHCSLNRTNPGVPLIVMGVEGDLEAGIRAEVEALAQYRLVRILPALQAGPARPGRKCTGRKLTGLRAACEPMVL